MFDTPPSVSLSRSSIQEFQAAKKMLRKGVLRLAACAQARRLYVGHGGTGATSTSTPDNPTANDDPTPAETKLAFTSTVYGKDPASAAELTAAQAATAEDLKRAAAVSAVAGAGAPASQGHDARAMFDSAMSQQAEDGKSSDSVKRDVAADTPDATRVAFRGSAYGKDPEADAAHSEQEVEDLRSRVGGSSRRSGAAPVHDSRNMFDSDLTQGAGSARGSDSIKRHVATDTPDATRVAFRASAYGKDPQAAAAHSAQEAAEVEALRKAAGAGAGAGSTAAAAPVHDSRSMFDSDLTQSAGSTRGSDSIKRDVGADTPDATRVAFRSSAYGKDPQGAAAHTDDEAVEVAALRKTVGGGAGAGSTTAAPVHDSRSMFDSDLAQGAGNSRTSDAIKRDVATDTPEATRLVFGGSDYGKDPNSMTLTAEKKEEIEALAKRAGAGTATADAAPIHHSRSMFDSDLTQSAGVVRDSTAINREVTTDTPDKTRLAFKASVYGKDTSLARQHADENIKADVQMLRERSGKGRSGAGPAVEAAGQRPQAPVHHDRSMFDSDLTQGAGAVRESAAIKRHVETDTPDLTRLSFFGSTCKFVH